MRRFAARPALVVLSVLVLGLLLLRPGGTPAEAPSVVAGRPDDEGGNRMTAPSDPPARASVGRDAGAVSEPEEDAGVDRKALLEEARRLYVRSLDDWSRAALAAEVRDGIGPEWLRRKMEESNRFTDRAVLLLPEESFAPLDALERLYLGNALAAGLRWGRAEEEGGWTPGLRRRAEEALAEEALTFPPEAALAALEVDLDRVPMDTPELRELGTTRARLLLLMAPSLTMAETLDVFARRALRSVGVTDYDDVDLATVAPDLLVHRQAVRDFEDEYLDLLRRAAEDLADEYGSVDGGVDERSE